MSSRLMSKFLIPRPRITPMVTSDLCPVIKIITAEAMQEMVRMSILVKV